MLFNLFKKKDTTPSIVLEIHFTIREGLINIYIPKGEIINISTHDEYTMIAYVLSHISQIGLKYEEFEIYGVSSGGQLNTKFDKYINSIKFHNSWGERTIHYFQKSK